MNRSIEFYLGMSREMKALKCSEMYINVDDMDDLITRLRQAEKDAARYRSAVSILGEASEMLQLLSLSASNVSERNMERVDAVVYEIDLELLKCNK